MGSVSAVHRTESMRTGAKDSQAFASAPFEGGINEALIECVKAAGGSKSVGPELWPEKSPDAAQRALLDALNEDRPHRLTPEQVVLVMRLARQRGCHAGMQWLSRSLGYADPLPVQPKDEAADLQRRFIEATHALSAMAKRIEELQR